jgi:hypothetical protein
MPVGMERIMSTNTNQKRKYLDESIIYDPTNNAILCSHLWGDHVAEVMSVLLDKEITLKTFPGNEQEIKLYATKSRLTVPERHSLAMMNRYFDEYRPGLRAENCEINLPYALHSLAAPVHFVDEADAYQLATAIEEVFQNHTDVVTTEEGFAVVMLDENGDLNGYTSERIAAIAAVVSIYDLTPKRKEEHQIEYREGDGYSAAPWQLRIAERHTQQQRIEEKLDRVLRKLYGGPVPVAASSKISETSEDATPAA